MIFSIRRASSCELESEIAGIAVDFEEHGDGTNPKQGIVEVGTLNDLMEIVGDSGEIVLIAPDGTGHPEIVIADDWLDGL